MQSAVEADREFELSDATFARIRSVLKQRSGIDMGDAKRMLVYGRLARRLRELSLSSFDEYLELVEQPEGEEARRFLNALTTNVTEFFRESHHFDTLKQNVVPEALRRNGRRLRVWSAGCSTGEEPYSIAVALREAGAVDGWDTRILATDIDSDVLARAAQGVYPLERVEKLAPARRHWFERGVGKNAPFARAKEELRRLVRFNTLNLLEPWPVKGPFDAIFCRNVVIYFDGPTRERLVRRFAGLLVPGGYLFMGHSEALTTANCDALEPSGRTTYVKRSRGTAP